MATTSTVQAAGKPQQRLSSQQLENVQYVGKAILDAKRSATPDPDLEVLRSELKLLHGQLLELGQLELNTVELKYSKSKSGAVHQQGASLSVPSASQKERSRKHQKAKELASSLVTHSQSLRERQDRLQLSAASSSRQKSASPELFGPLAKHFERVKGDFDGLENLSGTEYQQVLEKLQKATKVVPLSQYLRLKDGPVKDEQPTFTSRTQHRRSMQ